MNARRNRVLAVLALVMLAAVGCAQAGRSGAPPAAGGGASSTPAAPGGSGGPGGSGTPGAPGASAGGGGGGSVLAGPVPERSLTCGPAVSAKPAPLPDRDWVAVAWCQSVPIRAGQDHAVPDAPGSPTVTRGDLGPLVTALRQPDAPRSTGMCPFYRMLLPTIWLVDRDNEAFQPRLPVGACGQPAEAVTGAMRALGLR